MALTHTYTHTYTRTFTATRFADPYKKCRQCGNWIDGVLAGLCPIVLVPCEHQSDYRDVCSSWGPVDGCTCAEIGHAHDVRVPEPGDQRTY